MSIRNCTLCNRKKINKKDRSCDWCGLVSDLQQIKNCEHCHNYFCMDDCLILFGGVTVCKHKKCIDKIKEGPVKLTISARNKDPLR